MSLTTCLCLVACFHREAAEDGGKNEVDQRHDQRREDTLKDTPELRILCELSSEILPNVTKITQLDKEDGNHSVGGDPEERQEKNPHCIQPSLAASSGSVKRHVGPDDVVGPRSQSDCRSNWLLLAARVCNLMSFGDVCITCETIRHGASLINTRSHLLHLNLEIADALSIVLDGVDFLAFGIRAVGSIRL